MKMAGYVRIAHDSCTAKTQEMIMEATQQFRIDHGEWVCAGCAAPMTEGPEQNVEMTHETGCPELSNLRQSQA
jgi:hypothetical protein